MKKNKKFNLLESKAFWAVVSLLASLFIWLYVTGTQEETIKRTFNDVDVVLTGAESLQDSKGYVVTAVDVNTVSVTVSGTRANIGGLSSDDVKAVIDLSKITMTGNNMRAYTLTFPDNVNASAVQVVSKTPEYIQLLVSEMSTKTVPVKGAFEGSVAEGYLVDEPTFEPGTITLSGPDTELKNVDHVWATIGGDNVTATKTADVNYVLRDKDGNVLEYDDVTGDYDTVRVTLPVSVTKEVALTVSLLEGAGAALENCIISIEPKTITISGDASILNGINKIPVATIDLTDFESSYEQTYPIVLDNDVQNVTGETEAKVTIEVVGLETRKFSVTELSYINLPAGYKAEVLTRSIEVTVRGTAAELDKLKNVSLSAVADLSAIATTGDVSVAAKIHIAGTATAGAIGDYKMTVNIKG